MKLTRTLSALAGLMLLVAPQLGAQVVVLRGATIHAAADEPAIPDGVVIVQDGRIAAVGRSGEVPIPDGGRVIDLDGMVLLPGFWNSHVHFGNDRFGGADTLDAAVLANNVEEMLTRWGFTTVFDIGSSLQNTLALRQRIESGEIPGPRIFTTGDILHAPGTPNQTYTVADPSEALAATRALIDGGASAIKLYAQAWWDLDIMLSPEVIRAVVADAHSRGVRVFAHPSNRVGLHNAVEAGVDALVHTTPQIGPWDDALIDRMKAADIALIPTLSLWRFELQRDGAPPHAVEAFVKRGVDQLRQYAEAGGAVIFGTDVGYMTDFATTYEYEQMARAGMDFRAILASLTTVPAERTGAAATSGRIEPGYDADLVVVGADPAGSVGALADVRCVFRSGRLLYGSCTGS